MPAFLHKHTDVQETPISPTATSLTHQIRNYTMADKIPAPLKGKVAIVTGGSRGIGASIAQVFARQGCTHIATTYTVNKSKADEVLDAIRSTYPSIKTFTMKADVVDPDFGKTVVEHCMEGLGVDHVDIVVSNATLSGVSDLPQAIDMTHEKFMEWITGTTWAPIGLATAAIKHMPKGGRVIMISSASSRLAAGDPFLPYAAGKAAMEAASKQLAAAWGVSYGVTVNTISVGATQTESMEAVMKKMGQGWLDFAKSISLLKRIAAPEEVAEIVAFVASPQAGWITANMVPANGGALAMLQG